jgi:hypothetical protein
MACEVVIGRLKASSSAGTRDISLGWLLPVKLLANANGVDLSCCRPCRLRGCIRMVQAALFAVCRYLSVVTIPLIAVVVSLSVQGTVSPVMVPLSLHPQLQGQSRMVASTMGARSVPIYEVQALVMNLPLLHCLIACRLRVCTRMVASTMAAPLCACGTAKWRTWPPHSWSLRTATSGVSASTAGETTT